jgi:hypothetical protein
MPPPPPDEETTDEPSNEQKEVDADADAVWVVFNGLWACPNRWAL